jgi:opacity protein-like surface antigen
MFRRFAVAAAMLLLAALPATAQKRVQVTPFYGYMFPQGQLPERFALDRPGGGSLDLNEGEFESRTALYGATVALDVWKFLAVEATFVSGTDKFMALRREETDVQIMAYSAGIGIELPHTKYFAPYLLAGAGVKSYDFDIPDTKAEKDLEYNFGAGVNIGLLRNVAINVQARDFVSTFSSSLYDFEDEVQHDFFVAAGLTFRFDLSGGKHAVVRH